MEKVEVIEEKKMVKRLLTKFFGNIFLYGVLYVACMIVFLMFAIFQEDTLSSVIMMTFINVAINFVFIIIFSSSSINDAFSGINTVNVPEKSRGRMLTMVGWILTIIIVLFTAINIIIFHTFFSEDIQFTSENIVSEKSIDEIYFDNLKFGTLINVNETSENNYLVTLTTYSTESIIIIGSIIGLNLLMLIITIAYSNKILKKYLVT